MDLAVTNFNQKQKIYSRAPFGLIKWHLENMYGSIENIGTKSFKVFDTVVVTADKEENYITLEWRGDAVNDMIADSVLAVIIQSESSPASVKATKSSHDHSHHSHDHTDLKDLKDSNPSEMDSKDSKESKQDLETENKIKKETIPMETDQIESNDIQDSYSFKKDSTKWISNITQFLSNQFGEESIHYMGPLSSDDTIELGSKPTLCWKVEWDTYSAEIYVGQDGKGIKIVSSNQDTQKRITGIMNRIFRTMRPLEETWKLVL